MERPLKFKVAIADYVGGDNYRGAINDRIIRGVNLAKAHAIVRRAIRRGVKLYGGEVAVNNWGGRGGVFPLVYRSAVIHLDW